MALLAGVASRVVNPEIGDDLAGQLHRRFATYIRDDLEANLLYLQNNGEHALLVSLDSLGLETADADPIRKRMAAAAGIPVEAITISSTHTHSAPDVAAFIHDSPKNLAYLQRLADALTAAAAEAVSSARPAKVGWAEGEAHVGYNRRLCWADGTHTMYGDVNRPDFTGIEGPDDPRHTILYAVDEEGKYLGIVHSNSCHPVCMGGSNFSTADFPGEARREVRQALGREDLPVLYLNGASGDTQPFDMFRPHYNGEQRAREIGASLAAETLRLLHAAEESDDPVLRRTQELLELEVRLPTAEELAHAEEVEAQGEDSDGRGYYGNRWDYVISVCGTLRLWREYKDNPVDRLPIHALRVGDFALVTNPCELYCQFGIDVKRRSPAGVTMVAQITNGSVGYCPTIPSIMGGGYSGQAIYWTRLEPYAGYKLVEAWARMLNGLWRE